MQLLRLVAHHIKVGVPLPFGVRSEEGKLLLACGQVVASEAQLEALLDRGAYADVEEIKAWQRALQEAAQGQKPQRQLTLFDHWAQMNRRLDQLLRSLGRGDDFPALVDAFVGDFIALVDRDPDVAIYGSIRQDPRRLAEYGVAHALHTALAGQLMARRAGWAEERVATLVTAALTMNVATLDLQGVLAVHGERPTTSQLAQIRAHPQQAVDRLRAAGVSDEAWLQTVLEHHEQPGGGGYPQGLGEVCEAAVALRLADVFLAKISLRTGRAPLSMQEAAKQLFQQSGGSPLAAALIKEYGIYPPGDFVRLASGELAVVTRRGPSAHAPMVAAITDRAGLPTVRTTPRDTAQPGYQIAGRATDLQLVLRVVPERLYGLVG
ncbi:HD-GYP domain-containing protein [Methylibium sp.]|jgi:HD-GYP domain-containing protein (c-di-GMP phosphodiesterase class II)|uniref:HD-GYP domain-containing protein n=1 Tax=Methylibium sp. TaxID=2067992 RepID=UPI003D14CC14